MPGGRVVGAHGVRGALRLALELPWEALSAAPGELALSLLAPAYGRLLAASPDLARAATTAGAARRLTLALVAARTTAGGALVELAGLDGREAAAALRGAQVALPRACLPACQADEFWCFELQDMVAHDENGVLLGRIVAVAESGAQVLATLRGVDGREAPVPVVPALVRRVDRAAGAVVLRLPEGLWELTAAPPAGRRRPAAPG